jgi:hypothetical protein
MEKERKGEELNEEETARRDGSARFDVSFLPVVATSFSDLLTECRTVDQQPIHLIETIK